MLQDRHGQNVSFLLWSIWGSPDRDTLERGAVIASHWETAVLKPLRGVRNVLADPHPPIDDNNRIELREEVIAAELLAERVLLETLERLAPKAEGAPLESLTSATTAWRQSAPREALDTLASAIS